MIRKHYFNFGAILIILLMIPAMLLSQTASVKKLQLSKFQKKKIILPDLIVEDIKLVMFCRIKVTIKNIGRVGVPSSLYGLPTAVAIQMTTNGEPWGGVILKQFDPEGKLKEPGGSASWIWFTKAKNLRLKKGYYAIKVTVDSGNVLTEANESNNSLTRRVKCSDSHFPKVELAPMGPVKKIILHLQDALLTYFKSNQKILFGAQSNAISFGNDIQKCRIDDYHHQMQQNGWGDFFWEMVLNPNGNGVYRIKNRPFCSSTASVRKVKLNIDVPSNPDGAFIHLHFNDCKLIYFPEDKKLKIKAVGDVLHDGSDWKFHNFSEHIYHIGFYSWVNDFYWEVNTKNKTVHRVNGPYFGKGGAPAGNMIPLNIAVTLGY